MTPPEHRAQALELAERVYRSITDNQTLAVLAVMHAVLATAPDRKPQPGTWANVITLALLCVTVVAGIWLFTR